MDKDQKCRSALFGALSLLAGVAWTGWQIMHPNPSYLFGFLLFALGIALSFPISLWWLATFFRGENHPVSYMKPYEVIHFIADDTWWARRTRQYREATIIQGKPEVLVRDPLFWATSEFAEQARKECTRIKVYGRRDGAGDPTEIPHSFWFTNWFDMRTVFRPDANVSTSPTVLDGGVRYTDLYIERSGVLVTWRRTGIFIKTWDRIKGMMQRFDLRRDRCMPAR